MTREGLIDRYKIKLGYCNIKYKALKAKEELDDKERDSLALYFSWIRLLEEMIIDLENLE